jgi:uncharacterized protein (TIGR02270 family)
MTLRAHPGANAFLREFQERHLAEVEFLLEQRKRVLRGPRNSWVDAEAPELRVSRHLDAMRASLHLAVDCAQEALVGDELQFRAGMHVLAALAPEQVGIDSVVNARETTLSAVLASWVEALSQSSNPGAAQTALRATADPRAPVRASATAVLGYRRAGPPSKLLELLSDEDAAVRGEAALALARLHHRPALAAIESLLARTSTIEAEPLARAALMLGSRQALPLCRQHCSTGSPPPQFLRLLGLAGDTKALPILRRSWGQPELVEASLDAMGVLGLGSVVPALMSQLESTNPQYRIAAANALGLLSGAALKEKVRVSIDSIEDDEEVLEEERWSHSPTAWRRWWDGHGTLLRADWRWRHGHPLGLVSCLAELKHKSTPQESRVRIALELALQSQSSFDFEADWPVTRQLKVLTASTFPMDDISRGGVAKQA